MKTIVLASKSKDRSNILKRTGIPFETLITDVNEDNYKKVAKNAIELAKMLANAKVLRAKETLESKGKQALIIAADTLVEFNGLIIGKANSEDEAFQILKKLAGKTHNLITGVSVAESFNPKVMIDYDSTSVKFLDLNDQEIREYIKTEEWKGRAGAYSINDKASSFVEWIQGSSSNVMGLPMSKIYSICKREFELNLLQL